MPHHQGNPQTVRLNKFIADTGFCSRRKADELIANGQVSVNGEIRTAMGLQVEPAKDEIRIDGQLLQGIEKHYLAFHKPVGYLTTRSDEKGRKTFYALIPEALSSVDPAGRLDKNSSGLLILSNDGDFIHRISHPSFHIDKNYEVGLNAPLTDRAVQRLLKGVMLEPEHKLARMSRVEPVPSKTLPALYRMTLVTGYNRQIRRSLQVVGYRVKSLKRVSFGPVRLGDLKPGEVRPLTRQEKAALLKRE